MTPLALNAMRLLVWPAVGGIAPTFTFDAPSIETPAPVFPSAAPDAVVPIQFPVIVVPEPPETTVIPVALPETTLPEIETFAPSTRMPTSVLAILPVPARFVPMKLPMIDPPPARIPRRVPGDHVPVGRAGAADRRRVADVDSGRVADPSDRDAVRADDRALHRDGARCPGSSAPQRLTLDQPVSATDLIVLAFTLATLKARPTVAPGMAEPSIRTSGRPLASTRVDPSITTASVIDGSSRRRLRAAARSSRCERDRVDADERRSHP